MVSVALNAQAVPKIGRGVIVQMVDSIKAVGPGLLLREGLKPERLIRVEEAKQGALVLPEAAEQLYQDRDGRWMQGVEVRGGAHERGDRCGHAKPSEFRRGTHRR